jgi:hypothetical protein
MGHGPRAGTSGKGRTTLHDGLTHRSNHHRGNDHFGQGER